MSDPTAMGRSSQPQQLTEDPATIAVQLAVLIERVTGLQQIVTEREQSMRRALELQAVEYERRLAILNHEAERISSVQSKSVTAEKFDDYINTQQVHLDTSNSALLDKFTERARVVDEKLVALTVRMNRFEDERYRDLARRLERLEAP